MPLAAHDDAAGREVGALDVLHQLRPGRLRGRRSAATMPLTTSRRLCGGMFVAMPTAMPLAAVDQQVREAAGQHVGLLLRSRQSSESQSTVSLSMSVSISQADLGHAGLGVTVRQPGGRRPRSRSCPGRRRADSAGVKSCARRTMRVVHRGVAVRVVRAQHRRRRYRADLR